MILAGGEGKRLLPLTNDRAKPAVPFGGSYRLIDFVLSNFANAQYTRIVVLTQYKSHSLDLHISRTWRFSTLLGSYVSSVPAQMRLGPYWFSGSADAIYQNLNLVNDEKPDIVCVFGADHIYRMDPRQMVEYHREHGGGVTVAAIPVPKAQASAFGIIDAEADGIITRFLEKPEDPPTMPGSDDLCLASMGNYVFDTDVLIDAVTPGGLTGLPHDIGGDLMPRLAEQSSARVYDFSTNEVPGQGTWSRRFRSSASTTRTGRSSPTRHRGRRRSCPVVRAAVCPRFPTPWWHRRRFCPARSRRVRSSAPVRSSARRGSKERSCCRVARSGRVRSFGAV